MGKKTRIFKLAKELNIASDTLITFLRDAGFTVSNVNSPVDDDMYSKVMESFSDEKTLAEKKETLREKRARMREGVEESGGISTHADIQAVEKQSKEAKRPAILDALASLKKSAAEEKKKPPKRKAEKAEKPDDGKEIEVTAQIDEIKKPKPEALEKDVEEVLPPVGDEEKAIDEDIVSVEGSEAQILTAEDEIPEDGEKVKQDDVPVETLSEPVTIDKAEHIPQIGDQVDVIELPKKRSRKEKKSEEKISEIIDSKKSRKLSQKGIGLAEKIREKKQHSIEVDTPDIDDDDSKKSKKRKRVRKKRIDAREIDVSIKETLAKMDESQKLKKYKKRTKDVIDEEIDEDVIDVTEYMSVAELAKLMEVATNEVITKCLELGLIVSINQRLDMDTISTVADEFGFEVNEISEYEEFGIEEFEFDQESLEECPPVVTIMGHVDHGKTSLLDFIRQTNVVAGEKGGITQHFGAYEVEVQDKKITFLDTPGHEAFTAMRARGAQVTNIVVLVVAADDGVMPQTLEAVNHAQAAEVPIIVAINKIDKPEANVERIKQLLSENNILVESWGGKYPSVDISAKTGQGIDELLTTILIQAEVLEIKSSMKGRVKGIALEAKLEKGRGTVCSVLIQSGVMKIGDFFVCGQQYGRVKAMFNERGKKIKEAPPSTPVQILGYSGMPQAGDIVIGMDSDKEAKTLSLKRQQLKREHDFRKVHVKSLYDISEQVRLGAIKDLRVILKGDTDGSIEALEDSLLRLSNDEVEVKIIHESIGAINEADVLLASASDAIIIGFQVRPNLKARNLAEMEKVDIRLYDVIYNIIEDVKAALEGMLDPDISEEIEATVEVRELFRVPKMGVIAGCYVVSGKVMRNSKVRLVRDGVVVHDGMVGSLRRFKEDVKEVATGFECGIGLENFNDIKVDDILETYKTVEVKRVLQ